MDDDKRKKYNYAENIGGGGALLVGVLILYGLFLVGRLLGLL